MPTTLHELEVDSPAGTTEGSGTFELPLPAGSERRNDDARVRPRTPDDRPREARGGPRRYARMQIPAVRPEPRSPDEPCVPAGRMLDDEIEFMGVGDAVVLEVDALPAGHVGYDTVAGHVPPPSSRLVRAVRFTPQPREAMHPPRADPPSAPRPEVPTPPASSSAEACPSRRSSAELPAVAPAVSAAAPPLDGDPRAPGIRALAGYGLPPERLVDTPTYALRVLARQRILRRELAIARDRRSADVELYEAALCSADRDALEKGLVVIAAGMASVLCAIVALAFVLL